MFADVCEEQGGEEEQEEEWGKDDMDTVDKTDM